MYKDAGARNAGRAGFSQRNIGAARRPVREGGIVSRGPAHTRGASAAFRGRADHHGDGRGGEGGLQSAWAASPTCWSMQRSIRKNTYWPARRARSPTRGQRGDSRAANVWKEPGASQPACALPPPTHSVYTATLRRRHVAGPTDGEAERVPDTGRVGRVWNTNPQGPPDSWAFAL